MFSWLRRLLRAICRLFGGCKPKPSDPLQYAPIPVKVTIKR